MSSPITSSSNTSSSPTTTSTTSTTSTPLTTTTTTTTTTTNASTATNANNQEDSDGNASKRRRLATPVDMSVYPDVMIDLETLSTRAHAVVLTLGAIKFDRQAIQTPTLETMNTFYRRINLRSCMDLGLHQSESTIEWWSQQAPEARSEAFALEDRVEIWKVLDDFSQWFAGSTKPWSHGASFDVPILAEIYARLNKEPPWKFWNIRDTRTLYETFGVTNSDLPQANYHSAIHDCHRQIWGVQECYRRLNALKKK